MTPPVLIDSSLNVFDTKPILQTFLQTRKIKIRPLVRSFFFELMHCIITKKKCFKDGWKMGTNIDFVVPKLESSLLESDSFELVMTSQIQTAENKDPDDTVIAAPLDGVGLLAFESVSCQIGSEYICGDNKWDVYKVKFFFYFF